MLENNPLKAIQSRLFSAGDADSPGHYVKSFSYFLPYIHISFTYECYAKTDLVFKRENHEERLCSLTLPPPHLDKKIHVHTGTEQDNR